MIRLRTRVAIVALSLVSLSSAQTPIVGVVRDEDTRAVADFGLSDTRVVRLAAIKR